LGNELSESGAIYLQVYDEIFINGGKATENSHFLTGTESIWAWDIVHPQNWHYKLE
jgi:hypothetical protein